MARVLTDRSEIGSHPVPLAFHLVGQDKRREIVLRQKWSRGQIEARLSNLSPCLIGMEAYIGQRRRSSGRQEKGAA
jgi:hypothetical protein